MSRCDVPARSCAGGTRSKPNASALLTQRRWYAAQDGAAHRPLPAIGGPFRSMTREMCLEIAKARPVQTLVQIDFSHDNCAPFLGLGQRFAVVVPNRREHPAV